jgi:hypothetical protein
MSLLIKSYYPDFLNMKETVAIWWFPRLGQDSRGWQNFKWFTDTLPPCFLTLIWDSHLCLPWSSPSASLSMRPKTCLSHSPLKLYLWSSVAEFRMCETQGLTPRTTKKIGKNWCVCVCIHKCKNVCVWSCLLNDSGLICYCIEQDCHKMGRRMGSELVTDWMWPSQNSYKET